MGDQVDADWVKVGSQVVLVIGPSVWGCTYRVEEIIRVYKNGRFRISGVTGLLLKPEPGATKTGWSTKSMECIWVEHPQ